MKKQNKGVSLLITLLIMSAFLAIALGISKLTLGEIKLVRDIPSSLIAYYAAEAGLERAIYEERQGGGASNSSDCSIELDNGSSYGIEIIRGSTTTIKSIGCYKDIIRAIEITY